MNKKKRQEMGKLYCLSQLILESLDEIEATDRLMIKFKYDLIGFCEHLNSECANTYAIQKSTYFHEMTKKIDTIVRREFNDNM